MILTKKQPKKITDPVAQFLALASDPEAYEAKKAELDQRIERLAELTGIYKSVQEADAYRLSAKADRDQAASILATAKQQAETIQSACDQECAELKHEAESYLAQAKADQQNMSALRAGLGSELNALKADIEKREASLTKRSQELDRATAAHKAQSDALAQKIAATNRIWQ